MEQQETNQLYFTKPQLEFRYTAAHTSIVVAGRRFGKTHGIAAPWLIRNIQYMPRSSGGIIGSSFQQLLTRTLPGTLEAMKHLGFKRDVHYYVGRKPPKTANFQKPLREPVSYDKVIAWYNGSINPLISQDVVGSSNSHTFQYIMGDEAKFLNFDKLKDETFPANGGFRGPWKDCPWLNSMLFISDMPTTKKGSWFLNYKEKMDTELIDGIHQLVNEIWRLKQAKQSTYTIRQIRKCELELSQLRSVAVYYREWSSLENIELLGMRYIADQKRNLPPLVFLTSILCIRPDRLKDGFYPSLRDSVHLYTAFNNSYLDSLDYDFKKLKKQDCRQDGDLDSTQPICIGFDYNANINWVVAGQRDGMKVKVLRSFFVKFDRKLRELVDDFCEYYRYHATKEVVFYYDSTALGSNYAVSSDDFAAVICSQFQKNDWEVMREYLGSPMKHHEKYQIIDQAFKGQDYLMPKINEQANEALLIGLHTAGIRIGRNGWEKDKSGEKYAETEEDLLEYRTDGTDAFDTLLLGCIKQPYTQRITTTSSGTII